MPSIKEVKQRIKSVKNIAQITKAMEAVSATKMRRSQEFALRARPFAVAALEMLANVLERSSLLPSLFMTRPVRSRVLVVVTSDKGLAGALNANVLRKAEEWLREQKKNLSPYQLIVVGKKAKDYFERRKETIVSSFIGFGDYSTLAQTTPIGESVFGGFMNALWDEGYVAYTNFRSTLVQEVALKKILPVTREGIEEMISGILPERGKYAEAGFHESKILPAYHYEYKFEPSAAEILEKLVFLLLRMHIHHIILEANASEHSARMVAMKTASDNAKELMGNLQLVYNKARQAGITRELAEITAGKEALEH